MLGTHASKIDTGSQIKLATRLQRANGYILSKLLSENNRKKQIRYTYSIMSIPENPQNPGPFSIQHGYVDIKIESHKYSDDPTPFSGQQSKAQKFINSKTDKDHQKKYAKKAFGMIVNTLCK